MTCIKYICKCCVNLGDILEYGGQNAQDMTEAVQWYGLAAAQGDADAQFKMGYMLHYGQGVQENETETERWYRLAALQGHSIAKKKFEGLTAKKLKGFTEVEKGSGFK
jgi:TPR repeat protein